MQEVTEKELLDTYMVQGADTEITSWKRFIVFNDGDREFNGTLHWDSNDGYRMYWYNDVPHMSERPEFEYVLDCVTNGRRIPQYGDLSDAGMDGA